MSWLTYCVTLFLATISLITFAIDLYMKYSMTTHHRNTRQTERQLTNKYMTQITPASWAFIVWDVIYGLLVIWYLYIFYLLLCRQLFSGKKKSPLFPGIFWFIFIIVNVLSTLWFYLFLDNHILISGILALILIIMLYLLNVIAFRICWLDVRLVNTNNYNNDDENNSDDVVELSRCELILLRCLTLNGLPLYALWTSFTTSVQWSMILQYFTFHWSSNVSSIIALSVLSVVLLIYWHMDLLVKRKYFVYSYLPLMALVIAFALLIASSAMLLFKFISHCLCPSKWDDERRFSRV
jgi:hypothetical protein